MKTKEQLIIEHNLAGVEAEERANAVSKAMSDNIRAILDLRRMLLSYEMRLMDESLKLKMELEAFAKKLNN